jgi:hypothetical protein
VRPALQFYAANDAANDWRACGFVAAAIEYVGGSCVACRPIEPANIASPSYLRSPRVCATNASLGDPSGPTGGTGG